jgi:hypothetical protein
MKKINQGKLIEMVLMLACFGMQSCATSMSYNQKLKKSKKVGCYSAIEYPDSKNIIHSTNAITIDVKCEDYSLLVSGG